ncbi:MULTISPECIES: DUF1304 domain-containing protein [Exiguobacterium]|uniref:DUF1304 domain-containing protein n=1 Tax=Exiguobacterium TaxID=33986 RepID=UPI001BE64D65|nr:DUF1304 domain-containing protein [Exiguobacterium sp. s146]
MSGLTLVLGTLVAIEFFYIMYLETFATRSNTTARVFNMTEQELARDSVSVLFKNQGVYNGLIGVGLLYGLFVSQSTEIVTMILIYIVLVALYGSMTSNKKIILTQGGLAILTLLSMLW